MLVLEIIGVIVAILVIVGVLYWFNIHCEERFSHKFLTKAAFWIMAATMTVLFVGYRWRGYAETSGGDTLNGTILIAIGCPNKGNHLIQALGVNLQWLLVN